MWAFLLAQLLKNWSIIFFEKVTLLNLMPSTSPNWGGIPRWPQPPAPSPKTPPTPKGSGVWVNKKACVRS